VDINNVLVVSEAGGGVDGAQEIMASLNAWSGISTMSSNEAKA
jgi:hypothetical protein